LTPLRVKSCDQTPSLHNGRVLFGSPNDNFYCVDAATGEEIWSVPAQPHPNRGQVVSDSMPGGVVYFASVLGTLYARSIEDGSEVWTVEIGGDTDCAPSLDGLGRLFLGETDGVLVRAHSTATGATLWEGPSGVCLMRTVPTDAGRVYAAFRTFPGPLLCLETELGDEVWAFEGIGANSGATAIGHDGTIFFAEAIEAADLFAISANGQLLWRYEVNQQVLNPPIVDGDGRIYLGTVLANTIGQVHAVNPDGTAAWVKDMPNKCQPSPILAPDGTLYVSCKDKRVYAFKDPAKGDVSLNDSIDGRDIRFFIRVLFGVDDDPIRIFAADVNDDEVVDATDIPLFVDILLGNES